MSYLFLDFDTMNYISQHYSSLEQQINNTYEIETGFFSFAHQKRFFHYISGLIRRRLSCFCSNFH